MEYIMCEGTWKIRLKKEEKRKDKGEEKEEGYVKFVKST